MRSLSILVTSNITTPPLESTTTTTDSTTPPTTTTTTTAASQPNSLLLDCLSFSIDVTQQLQCNLTITYNCLSAQVSLDYSDGGSSGETHSLATSSQFTTIVLNGSRSYSTAGAFSLVAILACDNSTLDLQQIITVTDGRVLKPISYPYVITFVFVCSSNFFRVVVGRKR